MSVTRTMARRTSLGLLLAALSTTGAWVGAGAGTGSEPAVPATQASDCGPAPEHTGMDGEHGMMDQSPVDHHGSSSASPSPAATPAGHAHHRGVSPSPSTTGGSHEPGDCPEEGALRIAVRLTDGFRIEPATISVPTGVPVAFVITNAGFLPHEFVIGDEAAQQAHGEVMRAEPSMAHHQEGAVGVAPGETEVLTWVFHHPGQTMAGCHVSGHYAAGMRATITVVH